MLVRMNYKNAPIKYFWLLLRNCPLRER